MTQAKPLRKSLIPNTNNSSVNNGKYVSNVENAIRSYYSPYGSLPKTKKLQDAFKFYATQFDSNIPITLLFKSTADLFSTFPMSHYDASYVEFKAAVDDINANHGTGYRFSRIQNIDLFNLALRYNSFMNTTVKDDTNIPWEKVNQVQDSLVDMVRHTQKLTSFRLLQVILQHQMICIYVNIFQKTLTQNSLILEKSWTSVNRCLILYG